MSKRGKIIIIFFIGLMLMGVGSGIAFAEYSTFQYGGEKNFSGEMTTVTLHKTLPEDVTGVYILLRRHGLGKVRVEADETMEKDRITVEIVCDENRIAPFINEETEWPWDQEDASDKVRAIYSLDYYYQNTNNDWSDLFRIKDELLEDIKDRRIYIYTSDLIQEVTIKVSPELVEKLTIRR